MIMWGRTKIEEMITELRTKIELESDWFNSKHEYTQKHSIVTRPKYNPQQKRGKL